MNNKKDAYNPGGRLYEKNKSLKKKNRRCSSWINRDGDDNYIEIKENVNLINDESTNFMEIKENTNLVDSETNHKVTEEKKNNNKMILSKKELEQLTEVRKRREAAAKKKFQDTSIEKSNI